MDKITVESLVRSTDKITEFKVPKSVFEKWKFENKVKALTWETGNKHALVKLANGDRALISGGPEGIEFKSSQITTIFGHTHLTSASPSSSDFKSLILLGQSKQYVFHGGQVTLIRP